VLSSPDGTVEAVLQVGPIPLLFRFDVECEQWSCRRLGRLTACAWLLVRIPRVIDVRRVGQPRAGAATAMLQHNVFNVVKR
jgi:hypothetical protein